MGGGRIYGAAGRERKQYPLRAGVSGASSGPSEGLAKADIDILPIQDGKLRIWISESILRQPTDQIREALLAQA
jgi:hypothetical protein